VDYADPPLSTALDCRRIGRLLRREDGGGQKLAYVYYVDEALSS
jgi:hypothetical protein